MGARQKAKAREIIEARDFGALEKWVLGGPGALRTLFSLTFEPNELTKWRAIEAAGRAARILGESRLENVRDFIRRLLWLMNDESGGLGWYAPEVMGEILFNLPQIAEEYGVLLPHYTTEEPFERGSHEALARIAALTPDLIARNESLFQKALTAPDPYIRVYSNRALRTAKLSPKVSLEGDEAKVKLYDFATGYLLETRVSDSFSS